MSFKKTPVTADTYSLCLNDTSRPTGGDYIEGSILEDFQQTFWASQPTEQFSNMFVWKHKEVLGKKVKEAHSNQIEYALIA